MKIKALVPTSDQEQAIRMMVAEPTLAALNGSTMGTGKTLKAVEVVKRLHANTVLIIAPLGTRLGWKVTFERQDVTLPFRWLNSTKDGKLAMENWLAQEPGIYFVGTEFFTRTGWSGGSRTKTWTRVPDVALFDEAHRAQNRNSRTFMTLKQLKAGFKLSMSGTPTGNSFQGAWAVTKWLWPDLIDASYHNWVSDWCRTEYDHFAPGGKKVVGEKNPGEFFNGLPCYVRIESELDVDILKDQHYVELGSKQRKAYNDLEKQMITWVEGNPLVVEFPITLRARLRQASLGMFSVDDEGSVTFDMDCQSAKIDATISILKDDFENEPALILTDSQKFAAVVVDRINGSGKFDTAVEWSGKVSQARREVYKQDFIDGKIHYIVAVTSSLAEGIDGLQLGTRNILWLSRSDNRIINEQATARILRRGQTQQVRSIELIAVDTYDSGVLSSQMEKAIEMNKTLKGGIV
jgi:hypothetical protein